MAKIDLALRGGWAGFAAMRPFGQAQLRATRAEIPGIANPVQIQSAQLEIAENQMSLHNLAGQIGKIAFTGDAQIPRSCDDALKEASTAALALAGAEPCASRFNLQVDTISLDDLNTQFNPFSNVPWYKILASGGSGLRSLQASGRITVRRLLLQQLALARVATDFRLDSGRLLLSDSRADLLGGSQTGQWHADFTGPEPIYSGTGAVLNLSAIQMAQLLHTPLGTGTVSAKYQLTIKGWGSADLWNSAAGTADFNWHGGSWRNVQLGRAPLQFSSFTGRLQLSDGRFEITPSRMQVGSGVYAVHGSVSNGRLALQFDRGDNLAYRLSGTLQKPVVEAPPAATGALHRP